MTLNEIDFDTLASNLLDGFMDAIDEELGDILDVDIDAGILTIELESGAQNSFYKMQRIRSAMSWAFTKCLGSSSQTFVIPHI